MAESKNTTQLIKYDAACRAIATAKSVFDLKQIRSAAIAMKDIARLAKNKQGEADMTEVRTRCERRLGEMIAAQRKAGLLAKGTRGQLRGDVPVGGSAPDPPTNAQAPAITLAEMEIDKHLADTARKLAAVTDTKFEAIVADWRGQVEQGAAKATVNVLAKKTHVSNNSGENEWYTPAYILDVARNVMGGIDTDPASSPKANETVQATTFYTAEDDGLTKPWAGRVFLNPPYAQPLIGQFIDALASRAKRAEFDEAVILVNNATDTAWGQTLLELSSAVCFLKGRVRFLDPEGNPSGAPLQGQMLIYIGCHGEVFADRCAELGWSVCG